MKKVKKIAKAAVLTLAMSLLIAPGAFALNQNGTNSPGTGNKPLDFNGYQYVDSSHVKLFFNKSLSSTQITAGQFSVIPDGGSGNLVSSETLTTGTGYSGCSTTNLTKGSTVTLALSSALSADTLYDVSINGTTLADGDGLTFNNYQTANPFTFKLLTPESDGVTYDNTKSLNVAYSLGTSNVPYENSLVVVFDRPFSTNSTTLSTFISNLSTNYTKGGTTVVQDTNYSESKTTPKTGAECYYPTSNNTNNVNNTFFFPETVNTDSYAVYNRDSSGSHSYTLTLPTFTDVNGNTFTTPGSLSFSTVSGDLPGFLNNTPVVTTGSSSGYLNVSWSASSFSAAATSYDVYYIDSTLGGDMLTGSYSGPINTTSTSKTITGLNSGDLYYVRVVPKNSYGKAGYSVAGSGTAD
ncbi:conserved exported hypothetical protein [Candidatus Desulfosporosinus infrequens]|uniref:Fibronectin type-III domain-containing protein n=1 Tax=Candidatus Desulfosporosinus infrequens TaxID=2043169 RepID=A0A2U3KV90_9FIRM|nr:conserved exported hypothetical protein [Candidatus Desulfosporosinus infrequens]